MAKYRPAQAYQYEAGKEGQDTAPLEGDCPGCRARPGEPHTFTDKGRPCPEIAATKKRNWPGLNDAGELQEE